MDFERFVRTFGGIFEHSPWVAERAFDLELGPAHDSAGGLHNVQLMSDDAAKKSYDRLSMTDHPRAHRDWPALLRLLERKGIRYAD